MQLQTAATKICTEQTHVATCLCILTVLLALMHATSVPYRLAFSFCVLPNSLAMFRTGLQTYIPREHWVLEYMGPHIFFIAYFLVNCLTWFESSLDRKITLRSFLCEVFRIIAYLGSYVKGKCAIQWNQRINKDKNDSWRVKMYFLIIIPLT